MPSIIVSIITTLPIGDDSWLMTEAELARYSDSALITYLRQEIGMDILDGATWTIEREP
jgi:hypothetical protein